MKSIICILFAIFTVISCNKKEKKEQTSVTQSIERNTNKPLSFGRMNVLYVYTDVTTIDSELRDSLENALQQPYLLLPFPPELAIETKEYKLEGFQSGDSRTANNLFIANMQEDTPLSQYIIQLIGQEEVDKAFKKKDFTLLRVTDINASPQQIFLLLTNGFPDLSSEKSKNKIQEYASMIIEESTKIDNQRILLGLDRRSQSLEDKVKQQYGISMYIPYDYDLIIEEENFLWILKEQANLYSGIVFYKSELSSKENLEKQALVIRDELGFKISTAKDSSRMITQVNQKPFPVQRNITIGKKEVLETRGLWGMENDILGGSFVNYSFTNNNQMIMVDGFLYYGGKQKRRRMRDLDAIFSSISFND